MMKTLIVLASQSRCSQFHCHRLIRKKNTCSLSGFIDNVYIFYCLVLCLFLTYFFKIIVKMFLSYEVMAVFGVSMIVSFSVSVVILMVVAAKRGLLRVGARNKHATLSGVLLLPPSAMQLPKSVEMAPLATYSA